jgi:thioesterase domain-containing protein
LEKNEIPARRRRENMAVQRSITLATGLDGAPAVRADTDRRDRVAQAATPVAPQTGGERRNHLEVQLTDIWLEMLKLPRISPQEDFFDLGGDSLLATEMFHRVEQDCGCRVDPSRVLTRLTIERMAAEIMDGSRETFAIPVVQVQGGNSRAPFFFLHNDAHSGGFYCRRIARALGPDITMYAVQPHGLNGTAFRDSIEDMAAERVRSIMQVRPSGPLRIGGFCGGGVVAYEVARQLVAHGRRVETLLLIDTVAPSLDFRAAWTLLRRLAMIVRLSPATQRELFRRLKWYTEELQLSGRAGFAGWIALLWRKLVGFATRGTSAAAEAGAAPEPVAGDARLALWRQFHHRASVYVPGDYPGRVALFRSTYLDSPRATGTVGRWRMLTSGMEVHPIPGDHFTCVTTHAADLAAAMRPYLQN